MFFGELVDPVVADPIRQDNDKRNNIHIYIYIHTYGNILLKYTEGGDKTSQYSYLVVILSNGVPHDWVYRSPTFMYVMFLWTTVRSVSCQGAIFARTNSQRLFSVI